MYYLLGIFSVFILIIYREGKEHTIQQLRKETGDILNVSTAMRPNGAFGRAQMEGARGSLCEGAVGSGCRARGAGDSRKGAGGSRIESGLSDIQNEW